MGSTPLGLTDPALDRVLRAAAANLRADLGELGKQTMQAIQTQIPEYARPSDENYSRTVRAGVEQALRSYLDILEQHPDNGADWRAVYRAIGAGEAREGRSLDALQAAIRVGVRVGWHHLVRFAEAESLDATSLGTLADAIWAHVDDLAEASAAGYAEARAAEVGELDRRRRRLLNLLVAEPPASHEEISSAALAARWTVPRQLAVVAVEPGTALVPRPVLSPDVLADLDRAEPTLIVPDPDSRAEIRGLVNALRRHLAAVGPAVPPAEAANSLRWARRALDLARRDIIPHEGLVWCGDHLATLAIFQDEALLFSLVRRRLAPLAKVRENQREPLADTLLAWLQQNMNANAVAAVLHVHPQTVRRRLRQLDLLFGDQVHDSDLRFELEIALRADRAHRLERAP
jgi:DNA-binding protein Fis